MGNQTTHFPNGIRTRDRSLCKRVTSKGLQIFVTKKWDSLIDHLSHITEGGGVWRKYACSFCWQQDVETHLY
jgi:hypothetical protein